MRHTASSAAGRLPHDWLSERLDVPDLLGVVGLSAARRGLLTRFTRPEYRQAVVRRRRAEPRPISAARAEATRG